MPALLKKHVWAVGTKPSLWSAGSRLNPERIRHFHSQSWSFISIVKRPTTRSAYDRAHINPKEHGKSSAYDHALDLEAHLALKRGTVLISQADKKILRKFGERIRQVRVKKKLTVYEVTGDDMPIRSRQHWQKIEIGQKNVNLTTAFKIAKSLEVGIEELLKDIG